MKKLLVILMILLTVAGCAKKETVEPVEETEAVVEEETKKETYDIDISFGSDTIAYATVSNILENPNDYMDKSVKMRGVYRLFYSETTNTYYHVCMIMDTTACCSQGMEFMLNEGYHFPDDYPQDGREIIISGIVDTYMEGNYEYAYLKDAKFIDA